MSKLERIYRKAAIELFDRYNDYYCRPRIRGKYIIDCCCAAIGFANKQHMAFPSWAQKNDGMAFGNGYGSIQFKEMFCEEEGDTCGYYFDNKEERLIALLLAAEMARTGDI